MYAPSEEQLHRIIYSIWDFQQALSALTFLMEECDFEQKYTKVMHRKFKCYESQAIISFCRPFVASRSGVQLNCKQAGLPLDPIERNLKQELLQLRNKITAHSDSDEMHYKGVTLEIGGDSKSKAPLLIFDESLSLSKEQWIPFESLLHKLIAGLTDYTFKLCVEDPDRFETYKVPKSMEESN